MSLDVLELNGLFLGHLQDHLGQLSGTLHRVHAAGSDQSIV